MRATRSIMLMPEEKDSEEWMKGEDVRVPSLIFIWNRLLIAERILQNRVGLIGCLCSQAGK